MTQSAGTSHGVPRARSLTGPPEAHGGVGHLGEALVVGRHDHEAAGATQPDDEIEHGADP